MSKIKEFEDKFAIYNETISKQELNCAKTFNEAILYQKDVENNVLNVFDPLKNKFADLKTKTNYMIKIISDFKSNFYVEKDNLDNILSNLSTMDQELDTIKAEISAKAELVYNDKIQEYNNLKRTITDKMKLVNIYIVNYRYKDEQYERACRNLNNSLGTNNSDLVIAREKARNERESCFSNIEKNLMNLESMIKKVDELLDNYLKKNIQI